MALIIRVSPRALRDLVEIREYVLQRSPSGAEGIRRHLAATFDLLASFPMLGRTTDEPRVRVADATRYPYRVFYEATDDTLVIVHIRHTAREAPGNDDLSGA